MYGSGAPTHHPIIQHDGSLREDATILHKNFVSLFIRLLGYLSKQTKISASVVRSHYKGLISMSPILQNTVLNGASRHCLHKGFLLVKNDGQPVDMGLRDKVVASFKEKLTQKTDIADFKIKTQESHASLLYLVTLFWPIYNVKQ